MAKHDYPTDPSALVDEIFRVAIEEGAADLHVAPFSGGCVVRARVDGLLREIHRLDEALSPKVVSRIKVLAEMDIAERRRPQDGRITRSFGDRTVDFRVSAIPTLHGESLALRILDRAVGVRATNQLGFPEREAKAFASLLSEPSGLIVVTGPTGAGKTTTLYAALLELAVPERNVITIEDPIEYAIPGVLQTAVQSKLGNTFAVLLKGILRHDPDVVMVGEIRDQETAEVSVRAALTGHLVLTSLHTERAADAVTALLNFGVKPYALAPALRGVLAQQLIREICPQCRTSFEYGDELLSHPDFAGLLGAGERPSFSVGQGCERCFGCGYRGRRAILEVLDVDQAIQELILRSASADEIERAAVASGMSTLRRNGFRCILEGRTTVEEVLRAVHVA
ncbi:MAG: type II/IV secretion system protein [Planctomycetes bacterium]|nr:type II/IV secretion system protein [Planctomycetota bacterium]